MNFSTRRRLAIAAVLLALGLLAGWYFRRPQPAAPPPATAAATARPAPVAPGGEGELLRAVEAARLIVPPRQRSVEFGRRLQELLARDQSAALAYVRQLPPGADYTQGLLMVLTAIGQHDPDRALALAGELVTTREQRAIYSLLFAQLAAADPGAAVRRLAAVPAGDSRDYALRALADGWVRTDLPAALAWARQLDPADRMPAMESVLVALAADDPLQVFDLARQTLTGAAFDRTVAAALQSLIRTDPESAAKFVTALAPGEGQTQATLSVARALAARDPSAALAWSKTLPAENLQALALHNILDFWVAKDPAAAAGYVAQLASGPTQDAASEYVAHLLAAADPAGAIAWAQALAAPSARDRALVNIASTWAQTTPAAAARWADSLATADLRADALRGALSYWMQQDSQGARAFVFTLTGDTQARAAAFVAPALAQQDPVAAMTWSQTLPQAEARDAALSAAYTRWLSNAPDAARKWLAGANLPPATKARLLAPPPN